MMTSDSTTNHAPKVIETDNVQRERGKPDNQTLLILVLLFAVLAGLQIMIWLYPEEAMLEGIINGPHSTLKPNWFVIAFLLLGIPLAASFFLIAAIFGFLLRFTDLEIMANKSTVSWSIIAGVEVATVAYILFTFYRLGNDIGIF